MTTPVALTRAETVDLGEGVTRLGALVAIDERTGWVPPGTTGFEPFNVYVVREGDEALVVNSGPAVLAGTVLAQLGTVFPSGSLAVALTRNEFEVLGGLAGMLAAYPGAQVVYPGAGSILDWVEFRQTIAGVEHDLRREVPIVTHPFFGGDFVLGGDRKLHFPIPPLGTLSFAWIADERSGALFTSDAFGFLHVENGEPLVASELPARVTPEYVAAHLAKRFYWLQAADRRAIKAALGQFFSATRARLLCPTRGRVIAGEATVAAAVDLVMSGIDLIEAG